MSKKEEVVEVTANEVTVAEGLSPWELAMQAKGLEQAKTLAGLSSGPKFISFKGGNIVIDDVPVLGNQLDVVILTFASENTYYTGRYDPTIQQNPVCYSVYRSITEMTPSDQSESKQSLDCATCAKFKWASDPMGGKGKACKQRYRLALIGAPGETDTPATVEGAELRFASLPVTSGKAFDQFCSKTQLMFKRPPFGVITTISVIPDAKTQFKVILEPRAAVDGELMEAILKRVNAAEQDILYEVGRPKDEELPFEENSKIQ